MNLTYTLSEDDVAPPLPRTDIPIFLESRFDTSLNEYANQFNSSSTQYSGGAGYLGGIFPPSSYSITSGPIVTGKCIKCTNPCDAATKIQGCHPIYGPLTGVGGFEIIAPGCAVGYPGDVFGNPSTQTVVECGDCCNEDINNTINYQQKYHACDQCNIGKNEEGRYSIGVKKINNPSENILSTDIS